MFVQTVAQFLAVYDAISAVLRAARPVDLCTFSAAAEAAAVEAEALAGERPKVVRITDLGTVAEGVPAVV